MINALLISNSINVHLLVNRFTMSCQLVPILFHLYSYLLHISFILYSMQFITI